MCKEFKNELCVVCGLKRGFHGGNLAQRLSETPLFKTYQISIHSEPLAEDMKIDLMSKVIKQVVEAFDEPETEVVLKGLGDYKPEDKEKKDTG